MEKNVNGKKTIIDDSTAISLLKQAYNPEKSTKKVDERFHFHHKYTSIIQADGDNLSQALHAFYTAGKIEAVRKFSRFLMEFGEEATRKIEGFGGTPIYMGGDDLLFFAPVKCNNKTIFNLVDDLDKLFENKLIESKELNDFLGDWESGITEKNRRKKVEFSISYGISIGYHKYPLRESLETARKLLFDVSKTVPEKNALSFKVLKHGGQFFGATWRKDWRSYRLFLAMLEDAVIEDNFLTSVQHKLNPLRPVLYRILVGDEIDPAKASFRQDVSKHLHEEAKREIFLNRLNINFFNDLVHKEDGKRKFLILTFEYLLQVYRDMEDIYGNNRQTAEKAVDSLYAALRFIQFIYQPDHNQEEE
jgi:CRISPR-associated protein Cmr2